MLGQRNGIKSIAPEALKKTKRMVESIGGSNPRGTGQKHLYNGLNHECIINELLVTIEAGHVFGYAWPTVPISARNWVSFEKF